jgi:addiction module HigA family antidote
MPNGVYASAGWTGMLMMLKSPITTDAPHAGADLRVDLFEALDVTVAQVADKTGLTPTQIDGFLDGAARIDAEFDLRLGRYFGFSPGYFLRLQNAHDLREARQRAGAEIERIQPRVDRAA